MAKNLEFGYTTGQVLTAKLFAIGSDVEVDSADSVTEKTNAKSRYTATFTVDPANGDYLLVVFLNGDAVSSENYTIGVPAISQPWSELRVRDAYYALVDLSVDQSNTQDEYTVTWVKNDAAVTSGITSPSIHVVKRADGTDLIPSGTALTQIGSTGSYKLDEGTNRITNGEAILITVTATIDGEPRTFPGVVSRDSAA